MSVFLTCFVWRNYNFVFPKLKVLMRLLWILVESLFNVQSFFQKNKWHITASCWMEGLGNINRTSSCLHNKWVDYSALRAIAIACLYTHNSSYNMSPIKFITVLIMLLKIKVQLSIPFLTMFVVLYVSPEIFCQFSSKQPEHCWTILCWSFSPPPFLSSRLVPGPVSS